MGLGLGVLTGGGTGTPTRKWGCSSTSTKSLSVGGEWGITEPETPLKLDRAVAKMRREVEARIVFGEWRIERIFEEFNLFIVVIRIVCWWWFENSSMEGSHALYLCYFFFFFFFFFLSEESHEYWYQQGFSLDILGPQDLRDSCFAVLWGQIPPKAQLVLEVLYLR